MASLGAASQPAAAAAGSPCLLTWPAFSPPRRRERHRPEARTQWATSAPRRRLSSRRGRFAATTPFRGWRWKATAAKGAQNPPCLSWRLRRARACTAPARLAIRAAHRSLGGSRGVCHSRTAPTRCARAQSAARWLARAAASYRHPSRPVPPRQMLLVELEHRNIRLHEKVTETLVHQRYKVRPTRAPRGPEGPVRRVQGSAVPAVPGRSGDESGVSG